MRLIADTHVLLRWLFDARRLSVEQKRVLSLSVKRQEPIGISAITLLEIAHLLGDGRLQLSVALDELFDRLQSDSVYRVLPITYEIARESSYLGILRDPADRSIVATARVHALRLLTSDQRILSTNLVSTIH